MSNNRHSVILEKRDGMSHNWETVRKPDGFAVVLDGLSKENIAWLNTACQYNYRWVSND